MSDNSDRKRIGEALSSCIYIFDHESHPNDGLVNAFSGQVITDTAVNVDDSIKIGTEQFVEYERQWPGEFHNRICKKVNTMAAATKHKEKVGAADNVNTELIYARVIGIMASSRETISTKTLFSYKLSTYPSALFDNNGLMRSTAKSVLKSKLKVECGQRNQTPAEVVILDECAILWSLP